MARAIIVREEKAGVAAGLSVVPDWKQHFQQVS